MHLVGSYYASLSWCMVHILSNSQVGFSCTASYLFSHKSVFFKSSQSKFLCPFSIQHFNKSFPLQLCCSSFPPLQSYILSYANGSCGIHLALSIFVQGLHQLLCLYSGYFNLPLLQFNYLIALPIVTSCTKN